MNTKVSLLNPSVPYVDVNFDLNHLELSKASAKIRKQDQRALTNAGFGQTIGGQHLTSKYLDKVTEVVKAKLNSTDKPRSNSMAFKLERLLRQLDPAVVALCILQAGLHATGRDNRQGQRDVDLLIGYALNDELWANKLLQTDKVLARRINKTAKRKFGAVSLRKEVARREAEAAGFSMQDWSSPMLLHAGHWGMVCLLEALPDVLELTEPKGFHGEHLFKIKQGALEEAKQALTEAILRSPVYQPRTERPKDWETFTMSVAEDDRTMARATFLQTIHKDTMSATRYAMSRGRMDLAIRAVNAMQSVPWKINTWIAEVQHECFERGIEVDGLPRKKALALPERLSQAAFNALSVEERRLHAKTIGGLRKANNSNDADTMMFTEDMQIALRLATAPQFFTPMNLDWRGRVYGLTHFNFQREDRVRALFLFANGKPIGERGIYWLKVHVANSGDFDKVSKKTMEERVAWVDANIETILSYYVDPIKNTGWTKADAPFVFLAACRELVAALDVGPEYISNLPVSFDGSCNGLQHACAFTRSTEGRLVNLTANEVPADVYQVVADLTRDAIVADLDNNELFGKVNDEDPSRKTVMPISKLAAIALAADVNRGLVKRATMTFAYSSKEFGMSEQFMEDTMDVLDLSQLKGEIEDHPYGETRDEWKLMSRYLAKRTLAAIKSVVSKPAEAMEFMQAVAKALAHEGKPVKWISPAGVPCINRYHETITERIELFFQDKGIRTRVKLAVGFEPAIKKDKAASAISPNFVHSMDAAHLLRSVYACALDGITDVATVHDSFGCLPSDADRFNQIIRQEFVRMYDEQDVLAELLASAKADLSEANHHRLPELPAKGNLDLTEVLNARYAFA